MLLESQTLADGTGQGVETVRRVGLPVRIAGDVVEGYPSGIVAPGAIIGLTPVFTLRAFVTVSKVHGLHSFIWIQAS